MEQFFANTWPNERERSRIEIDRKAGTDKLFLVGQDVYVRKTTNSKLSIPWRGPFSIERIEKHVAWIKLPEGLKAFHFNELKLREGGEQMLSSR